MKHKQVMHSFCNKIHVDDKSTLFAIPLGPSKTDTQILPKSIIYIYIGSFFIICGRTSCLVPFTLPEINSSHLKMDGWDTAFLLGFSLFSRGELLVSGRVSVSFPMGNKHPPYDRR